SNVASNVRVAISPQQASIMPGQTVTLTADVSGTARGQSSAVIWSVQEGASGGTVDSSGKYTAPTTAGSYHVVATSVADSSKSATATVTVDALTALAADRRTAWNPGVPGGIPARTTVCANVSASTYGDGARDATAGIQAAIDACPLGQVVLLSAGGPPHHNKNPVPPRGGAPPRRGGTYN